MTPRVYLDWNATTPLRPEARAAMQAAMDAVGNPSSVHAEGRAARGIVERARIAVATAFGAYPDEVIFTSGATEAAALALAGRDLAAAPVEHDCVAAWTRQALPVGRDGRVAVADPAGSVLQAANSETGVLQDLPAGLALVDAAQIAGKAAFAFGRTGATAALLSAHKFGGPKGAGALLLRAGASAAPTLRGGGQETGRRAGTENLVGIAGFGAAAAAAARDLADGVWERVAELRNILEGALASAASETIFVGKGAAHLPNTICLATPGWKGETQVMQMDLAGFAISSGSACSSGKVRPSRVIEAMGLGAEAASGAIRVSIGPATTEAEALAFADAWQKQHRRFRAKAAVAA
ncbi:MAG: aminotransferase class V-fold PLP-dependent enzyme [Rhodobacteraceae bacterium]|nr:aminotransferase class V-fold PLP-dependent enzyme [Paracoccaceae bacterium]